MASPAFENIGFGRSPSLPAFMTVKFRGRRCNGLVSDDPSIPDWYIKNVPVSTLTIPVPFFSGSASGIGNIPIADDALALYQVGGANPTNQTNLDNLSKQIFQDFVNWRSLEFDQTYNGILATNASGCGIYDMIEWSMDSENVKTRIFTSPWGANAEQFNHNDPANAGCIDVTGSGAYVVAQTPCVSYYGPLAFCVSGSLHIPRSKICLEDGRLFSRYITTDIIQASG